MSCIRYLVSGRVQGVFYRASTQDKGRSLGLNGWAKNLPDGRVEVLACGNDQHLKELEAWLWQGPAYAKVSDVVIEVADESQIDYEQFGGFGIRY